MEPTPIQVLLVEDSPTDALLARSALEDDRQFRLVHTERLDGALELLPSAAFDVVLLDLGLPDSQGLDTLARLRRGDPSTAVIVMTGLDDEEMGFRAIQVGAHDYLVKGELRPSTLARAIRYAAERRRAEGALRESERRLAAEAAALERLNAASSRLWGLQDERAGLAEVLAATIALLGADMGNVQLLNPDRGVLEIAAQQGFGPEFLDFFREVSVEDDSACGRTLRTGSRTVIEDVETDEPFAPLRPVARAAGYRAVQSTPLCGRDGRPLGMLSTHFRSPHRPTDQDLRRLDLYARQAADFIERCRTGEALRASEEQTRRLLDFHQAVTANMWEGLYAVDDRGRVTYVNPAAEKLFGWAAGELLGRRMHDVTHHSRPDGTPFPVEECAGLRVLHSGTELTDYEDVFIRKDGTFFPVTYSSAPLRTGGRTAGLVVVFRDVTERKRAEEALRDGELLARGILDSLAAHIAVLDPAGLIVTVNAAWEAFARAGGIDPGRCGAGVNYLDACRQAAGLSADEAPAAGEGIRAVLDGRAGRFALEYPCHGPGVARWFVMTVTPLLPGRRGAVVSHLDITERRQSEDALRAKTEELKATTRQLWQAARLAGVGELAASIAHELNNPLGTIALRVEGALAKTPPDDPRRRALEVIDQEVQRMADLVGNLLGFARAGRDQVSVIDLREEATKTVELIDHHLTRKQVRVETEFAPDAPAVNADRQQVRQVLLNLLTNAGDAMPDGGRLGVRVRRGELGGKEAAVLEVADTGTGIPPELLGKVFDPFFTTKEEGKGTGLGLPICKRIVEQHHGALEIESVVGEGTTIRITLPVRAGAGPGGSHPG